MSNPYKSLGGQALVYGLGNIIPRLLNYAVLTVYYTRRFEPETYGVITELYAYVAIFMVILTYGMETGLFKFSGDPLKRDISYSSILTCVTVTSAFFVLCIYSFRTNIAEWIGYKGNPEYILYLGIILAMDAVSAIVFARLRIENKVRKFAIIKILNVVTTIFFVFLFLEVLPRLQFIASTHWYLEYFKDLEVGYVFISNVISSFIVLLVLIPEMRGFRFKVDRILLSRILAYSIPLLVSGLAGIFNETIDRILLKHFTPDKENALYELGIYGANYRIAVLMTIFVQMFRYAAEPFFFNLFGKADSKKVYSNVLKYFTIFLMVVFLGVGLGIDFFKLFIDSTYHEGLGIVPVVLFANVLVGLLFNVNMWYKLSGHTLYGVYITGTGAIVTIVLNILLIPRYGFYACAWIHLLSNALMLVITYTTGQKHYKIDYDLKSIGVYLALGLALYTVGTLIRTSYGWINVLIGMVIVAIYIIYANKRESLVSIFFKKHENQNR